MRYISTCYRPPLRIAFETHLSVLSAKVTAAFAVSVEAGAEDEVQVGAVGGERLDEIREEKERRSLLELGKTKQLRASPS